MTITIEQLTEFMQSDENKGQFESIVKEMGFQSKEDIDGLVNKKNELLGKLVNQKKESEKLQSLIEDLQIKVDNPSSGSEDDDELIKVKRLNEKLVKDYEKLQADYSTTEGQLNSNIIESDISNAIEKANIDPKHKSLLISAFTGKAKIESDGTSRTVLIDNNGDGLGLPVNEFFQEWVNTDNGKTYIAKPENKGTGSGGFSGGSGSSNTIRRSDFSSMSPESQNKAILDGATIID